MTTKALYRKYRPQSFDEIRGQEAVVQALSGQLENDNISHSYLFAGSHGTGKTSVARIFARNLGCSDNDIHEIDAASNRGIDDIRELREAVYSQPMNSPYKVYIIDEVHMLSKDAFNALLKTLEEPPAHVIFILATTELHKLLETVISRCQVFHFATPNQQTISELLVSVAEQEGYELDLEAAELVSILADGSFRDGESILQKVLSSTTEKQVTGDAVAAITGAPERSLIHDCISGIAGKDSNKALGAIRTASNGAVDMQVFTKLVLQTFRRILLVRYASSLADELKQEIPDTEYQFVEQMKGKEGKNLNSAILKAFLSAEREQRWASVPALPLEIAVMDVVVPNTEN